MSEIISTIDVHHLNVILMMGIVIFGGIIGAKLFQKLHIPQVIGYIVIGLIIGESGFRLVGADTIKTLEPLNYFALGIIGFMIGGELKSELFKKYGKQFTAILIGEGVLAFVIVGCVSTGVAYLFTKDAKLSVALGVVLGAISSATDPASTIQVMWEYKTRGVLTTAATAIVALDDALALTLYGIGTSVAGILTGGGEGGIMASLGHAAYELLGALVLGVISGFILDIILKKIDDNDSVLAFALGIILLTIGISVALKLDVILSSMAVGLTLVNVAPRASVRTFDLVKKATPPIYILFFVFVGAGIKISNLSMLAWVLVIIYVIGRSVGKMCGASIGAKVSGAASSVKKYLGLCLFAQGGVAVGLSIVASHKFADQPQIAQLIVIVVTTTTLIVQFLGPSAVKIAVKKAGEINMNITDEDLIKTLKVSDVMETEPTVIKQDDTLKNVLDIFGQTDSLFYPVVDRAKKLIGVITIEGIKETFKYQDSAHWLLACDVMLPVMDRLLPNEPLEEAIRHMRTYNSDYACIVDDEDKMIGLFNLPAVNRRISAEVLARREQTDAFANDID
ncbi:MAG: cation:proton antiporter [Sedimentisphaeraceae bacterium JB056]